MIPTVLLESHWFIKKANKRNIVGLLKTVSLKWLDVQTYFMEER